MNRRWLLPGLIGLLFLSACRTAPVSLTPMQIAERSKSATVLIFTKVNATGTIPNLALNTNHLKTDASARFRAGDTDKDMQEKYVQTFLDSPEEYLREGDDTFSVKTEVGMLGTGFIVTPDGYVLTNAHVVKPDKQELAKAVLEKLSDEVDHEVDGIKKSIDDMLPGETISESGANHLRAALLKQYAKDANLDFQSDVLVVLSPKTPGGEPDTRRCDIKKLGEVTPGKDVAVLKIMGSDLPTLPLAQGVDSGGVSVGSDLLILGYPGQIFKDPDITDASKLQPSLTIGHVSGIRDMAAGFHVIQTDATINHGNSGGPALNDFGQVVGQATFMEADSQGLNFAIDIGVAREFLQELNVNLNSPSRRAESALASTHVESSSGHRSFPIGIVLLLVLVIGAAVVVAIVVSRS
jgi:serine protease Do